MNKIILILFLFVGFDSYADSTYVNYDNTTIELTDFESFKTEFKLMCEQQVIYKSGGSWNLAFVPLGVLTITSGLIVGVYGVAMGVLVENSAEEFKSKVGAGGLIVGGVVVGSGLIYLGGKLIQKGFGGGNKAKRDAKQQQLDSIEKLEKN